MPSFDSARANTLIAGLELGPLNRELAGLWLSLWDGGALPMRGAINPSRFVRFLPGLAIMDLHPDDSVRFRIAGQSFRAAYGFDPSHHDMVALTPREQREQRVSRCRSIVDGAIGAGLRSARRADGNAVIASQDIVLPLGGINEDGSRSWLFHTAWRPARTDWQGALPEKTLGLAEVYVERALA